MMMKNKKRRVREAEEVKNGSLNRAGTTPGHDDFNQTCSRPTSRFSFFFFFYLGGASAEANTGKNITKE